jgi:hypothetical protein
MAVAAATGDKHYVPIIMIVINICIKYYNCIVTNVNCLLLLQLLY